MSAETTASAMTLRERPVVVRTRSRGRSQMTPLEEFEQVYLRNVDVLMGYFARRCSDPHTVADLTSETFVRAMDGFAKFDPRRGSDRAWLFGIATHVFARHCEQSASGRDAVALAEVPGVTVQHLTDVTSQHDVAFRFPFTGGVTEILFNASTHHFVGYVRNGVQTVLMKAAIVSGPGHLPPA